MAWACRRDGGWFGGLGFPISAWWWLTAEHLIRWLGFPISAWWWLTAEHLIRWLGLPISGWFSVYRVIFCRSLFLLSSGVVVVNGVRYIITSGWFCLFVCWFCVLVLRLVSGWFCVYLCTGVEVGFGLILCLSTGVEVGFGLILCLFVYCCWGLFRVDFVGSVYWCWALDDLCLVYDFDWN